MSTKENRLSNGSPDSPSDRRRRRPNRRRTSGEKNKASKVKKAEDKAKAAAVRQKDLEETEAICKEFRQHDATIAATTVSKGKDVVNTDGNETVLTNVGKVASSSGGTVVSPSRRATLDRRNELQNIRRHNAREQQRLAAEAAAEKRDYAKARQKKHRAAMTPRQHEKHLEQRRKQERKRAVASSAPATDTLARLPVSTSASSASFTDPVPSSVLRGVVDVNDDITQFSGLDNEYDEYDEEIQKEDAQIAASQRLIDMYKNDLEMADAGDLQVFLAEQRKNSEQGQLERKALVETAVQTACEAGNKQRSDQEQQLSDYMGKRSNARAMVAAGPINLETSKIAEAKGRKSIIQAKQKAAVSCCVNLGGYEKGHDAGYNDENDGEYDDGFDEDTLPDLPDDETVQTVQFNSYPSNSCDISIDRRPMDDDEKSKNIKAPKTPCGRINRQPASAVRSSKRLAAKRYADVAGKPYNDAESIY